MMNSIMRKLIGHYLAIWCCLAFFVYVHCSTEEYYVSELFTIEELTHATQTDRETVSEQSPLVPEVKEKTLLDELRSVKLKKAVPEVKEKTVLDELKSFNRTALKKAPDAKSTAEVKGSALRAQMKKLEKVKEGDKNYRSGILKAEDETLTVQHAVISTANKWKKKESNSTAPVKKIKEPETAIVPQKKPMRSRSPAASKLAKKQEPKNESVSLLGQIITGFDKLISRPKVVEETMVMTVLPFFGARQKLRPQLTIDHSKPILKAENEGPISLVRSPPRAQTRRPNV